MPNREDAEANFLSLGVTRDLTVGSPMTVGTINFDSGDPYTIAGPGEITLATSSGVDAQIIVLQGDHKISAPLSLADDALTVEGSTDRRRGPRSWQSRPAAPAAAAPRPPRPAS